MKLLMMELVVGIGEVVIVGEVAQIEVVLEVEVFGVENVGALVAGENVRALGAGENVGDLVGGENVVAEENVVALVVEVDQTRKVSVVDGDQREDLEAGAMEGVTNLVVGITEGILVGMGPLTGRRREVMLKDGRIVTDPGLGTGKVAGKVATRMGRAGAWEMQIRSVQAGAMEVEVISNGRAGAQVAVELVVLGIAMGQNRL